MTTSRLQAADPSQAPACDNAVCCTDGPARRGREERTMNPDQHLDQLAQFDLHTEIHGGPSDAYGTQVPVVLVHGSWTDASSWQLIVPALAAERLVVAYDRRGHSRSPWPDPVARRQDEDDLIELVELLGLGPVHLVSNSYGSSISLAVAARRSDLVASVVAHEPPLLGVARPGTHLGRQADELRALSHDIAQQILGGDPEAAARRFTDVVLGAGAWQMLPVEFQAAFVANASTFAGMIQRADWDRPPEPCDTTVPIVLTTGTQSPSWLPSIVDELTSSIYTHAERQTYAGAGHVPHLTHPAAVVATVDRAGAAVGRSVVS